MALIIKNKVVYGGVGGGDNSVDLTMAEYKALEAAGTVMSDTTYYITDADNDQYNASSVVFDDTNTQLGAVNVQVAIEKTNDDINELNSNMNIIDEAISKLSEDIATKASAIKEKASGELIIVNDSAEAKVSGLAIDGKSEQNQLSGKNLARLLIDVNNEQAIDLKAGNPITFGVYPINGASQINIMARYEDGSAEHKNIVSNGDQNNQWYSKTFTYTKNVSSIAFYDVGNNTARTVEKVMACYGTETITDDNYEPYCGGIPSPNPSYPQEIRNIGVYDEASGKYAVEVKGTGKNLLKNNAVSKTESGITITVDDDGVITVNGTSTAIVWVAIKDNFSFNGGLHYILSGCPVGGSNATYFVYANGYTMNDNGKGVDIIYDENTTTNIGLCIRNGVTVSNLTFKPMLRHAEITDDTYEPYKETTVTVLLDEPLRKGDKAYWNGGSKARVDRNRIVLTDFTSNGKDSSGKLFAIDKGSSLKFLSDTSVPNILCKEYISCDLVTARKVDYAITQYEESLYVRNKDFSTVEEFNAYLAENPLEIEGDIAEPITEEIDIDLGELTMFYPTTILSNDCNANMEVTYIADTKNYIDKLKAKHESDIKALKTAIVALGGTV